MTIEDVLKEKLGRFVGISLKNGANYVGKVHEVKTDPVSSSSCVEYVALFPGDEIPAAEKPEIFGHWYSLVHRSLRLNTQHLISCRDNNIVVVSDPGETGISGGAIGEFVKDYEFSSAEARDLMEAYNLDAENRASLLNCSELDHDDQLYLLTHKDEKLNVSLGVGLGETLCQLDWIDEVGCINALDTLKRKANVRQEQILAHFVYNEKISTADAVEYLIQDGVLPNIPLEFESQVRANVSPGSIYFSRR